MSQYTQATLTFLRGYSPCSKGGVQSPFMLRNSAFNMPPSSHHFLDAASLHFSAIRSLWPTSSRVASIKGNYRGADSQLFPTQLMIMFSVVSGVCQEPMPMRAPSGLKHGFGKLWGILAWAVTDHGGGKQMCADMANQGQFWKATALKRPISRTKYIIFRGMPDFQARGVNGRFRPAFDQFQSMGSGKNSLQQTVEIPFFNKRPSA
jgi:hypothetical protein